MICGCTSCLISRLPFGSEVVDEVKDRDNDRANAPSSESKPQVDWGDALDVPTFYGRREELALLSHWVIEERCRVVSILGMGGFGKSALAVTLMRQIASQFEVVIWRSLRDAPSCVELLEALLQVLPTYWGTNPMHWKDASMY